jgi:hypothetical protein
MPAIKALALPDTCSVRDKATIVVSYAPADLASWYEAVVSNRPNGYRYATDAASPRRCRRIRRTSSRSRFWMGGRHVALRTGKSLADKCFDFLPPISCPTRATSWRLGNA